MAEEPKKKQPLPLWRKILLTLIAVAMLLMIMAMLANYIAGKLLSSEVIKIAESKEPLSFLELAKPATQDNAQLDAGPLYFEALSVINTENFDELLKINILYHIAVNGAQTEELPAQVRQQISQQLTQFQPALDKIEMASDLPLPYFDMGVPQGIDSYKLSTNRVRMAAYLLSLRSLDSIMNKKGDAAARDIRAILKLTRVFDAHPTFFMHEKKMGLIAVACQNSLLLLQHTNPSGQRLLELQKALLQHHDTYQLRESR